MKIAKIISFLLLLGMTIGITFGLIEGDFWGDGSVLMGLLWGKLTLVDFYVGITLFSGWVIFRECSWWRSMLWIILLILLGNWTTSLYVFIALIQSRDSWSAFGYGNRRK
ncbi:DUF1475 domain-containing protein [Paenibacillus psychroresistens]|uniref:DUF1475 domain-containing protein n=1 Tax=Paenibacillus psychroresistens TaxID=1778678 RepID=A0A6B8RS30_9BACL|nr:DUF1475 family protein [Paenibacillus psychroresistens]QGQ98697.1 DUF1475 domain-containing protein [Paenibacillus psychroresistens]